MWVNTDAHTAEGEAVNVKPTRTYLSSSCGGSVHGQIGIQTAPGKLGRVTRLFPPQLVEGEQNFLRTGAFRDKGVASAVAW